MKRTFSKRVLILFTLLAAIVAGAVMLGAQDDDLNGDDELALLNERGVAVYALEDVTESPAQLLDLTATSARVNFVGTIPLACTLLFGTTPDFGNASVDADMNGATIIEHNPLMLNLEPDTEYFYRLQGSDVNGNFYTSEVMSFRTPAADDTPPENLLSPQRGAEVVAVSSNFGGAANDERWGILNAFDDNLNTAWASDGDGDDASFTVQLDAAYRVTTIEIQSRLMRDGTSQVLSFQLIDGEGNIYGPFDLPEEREVSLFEVDFVAEQITFEVASSTGGNTGLDDIALYGELVE